MYSPSSPSSPPNARLRKSLQRLQKLTQMTSASSTFNISCDAVRSKIRNFLASGEMKVGEFQKTIGTNSNTYGGFMRQNGAYKGSGSTVYCSFSRLTFMLQKVSGVASRMPPLSLG